MMSATHVSDTFEVGRYNHIPRTEGARKGCNLSELRESLQSTGHLRSAQMLLGMEIFFLDSQSAKEEASESLLQACLEDKNSDVLWDAEGFIRLDLAKFYSQDGKKDAARVQFHEACTAFRKAPVPASENYADRYIKLSELKANDFADHKESFNAWKQFFDECSNLGDLSVVTSACSKVADAAFQIYKDTRLEQDRIIFWSWQSQAEKLLEDVGDLYFMYLGHITTSVPALGLVSNNGAILQWHEDFEAKYPYFNLWNFRLVAKAYHQGIFTRIDDERNRNTFKNAKEISDIFHDRKVFWEEPPDHTTKPDNQVHSIASLKGQRPKDAWFHEWSNHLSVVGQGAYDWYGMDSGTLTVKPYRVTVEILLRWVREGITKKQLTEKELETILNKASWSESSDVYTLLDQVDVEHFANLVLGSSAAPVSSDHWSKTFAILSNWLGTTDDHHHLQKPFLLLRLQHDRLLRVMNSECSAREKAIEAERLLEFESKAPKEIQEVGGHNVPAWRNVVCSLKTVQYQEEHGHPLIDEESPEFQEILRLFQISLKEFQESGLLVNEANTQMMIAELYYCPAQRLHPQAMDPFQGALRDAEITYQKIREGWKILRGWDKVDKVLSASEEKRRLMIHPLALGVIRQIPDTLQVLRGSTIWSTVQSAKSIGLGWLMQINKIEPSENSPAESKLNYSDFQKLPNITTEELQAITDDNDGDVVYVDWYRGSIEANQMPCPIVATLSPGNPPQASFVNMSWEEIDKILDKWLAFDDTDLLKDDARAILQQLSPLLEPLKECSKPGQVIVLSPTGGLSRVPLHAITIDEQILIQRNPVVYTSSLTVLNVLFKARKEVERRRISTSQPFKAAVFGEPPTKAGKNALNFLSETLSVDPCRGFDFTTHRFKFASRDHDLDLLHYHSHAKFKDTDPKSQSLIFDDNDISLTEVFALPFAPNSCHVTLLGCGSGMTKTSAVSGEIIGLVPAFLYSGAGSTVSTLWPFDDRDAALYTRYFYESVFEILKGGRADRVDLARANQAAILKIMDAKAELYHWAPFILNGYWKMSVRGVKKDFGNV